MKAKRLLLLVMAICLASVAKAQFYDGPDDIFYYVEDYYEYEDYYWDMYPGTTIPKSPHYTGQIKTKKTDIDKATVLIFNFDGLKAAELTETYKGKHISWIKAAIANNPNCYEDKIETTDYDIKFSSKTASKTMYQKDGGTPFTSYTYTFSSDRKTLRCADMQNPEHLATTVYKRVDKSFFKIGRSRTPSGTLHE